MSAVRAPLVLASALLVLGALALVGCDDGSRHAQEELVRNDIPRVQAIVREDIERALAGVQSAATKMARGFQVEDRDRRQREMRTALHLLRQPPRGIPELMISPISFLAAVDADGTVICRDQEPDPMAGFDAGREFEIVRRALAEGVGGYALEEFPAVLPDEPGSQTVLYVAPSVYDGRVVGAVLAGTPLWRTAQRLERQLQAEHADEIAQGLVFRVEIYQGDRMHHSPTPMDLDQLAPTPAARGAGYARSPGGFTGTLIQYGRTYAYGVVPLPRIGPDVGVIVFRSDPGM